MQKKTITAELGPYLETINNEIADIKYNPFNGDMTYVNEVVDATYKVVQTYISKYNRKRKPNIKLWLDDIVLVDVNMDECTLLNAKSGFSSTDDIISDKTYFAAVKNIISRSIDIIKKRRELDFITETFELVFIDVIKKGEPILIAQKDTKDKSTWRFSFDYYGRLVDDFADDDDDDDYY